MVPDPSSHPPLDLAGAIEALQHHGVRWLIAGSVVLRAYGARVTPGDLDVVPALDDDNLRAVAALLHDLEAIPYHFSDWPECPPLGWHETWRPQPPTVANLDHLFVTSVGRIDIVPRRCGTYDELAPTARGIEASGHRLLLAHPSTVLTRITSRNRRKDHARQRELDALGRELAAGRLQEPSLSTLL